MMKRKKAILVYVFTLINIVGYGQNSNVQSKFVDLKKTISDIEIDLRYNSSNNFTGKKVEGYQASVAYLTKEAAAALTNVANELRSKGLALKVFDAYRPQAAVKYFGQWAQDLSDTIMKSQYYPAISKSRLYGYGYISTKSGHSRGSTIDLTLVNIKTKQELDMGSPFDFFGEISQHNTTLITPAQSANRKLLKTVMEKYGFKSYWKEWWHYTLANEPYPNTYFNFPVK